MGRGIGSGGKRCGRGSNGQKARSGPGIPRGFEGGQTPLHIRMPKRGHRNPHHKDFTLLGLDRLQHLIDTGRLNPAQPITIASLAKAGINGNRDGVKITGRVNCSWPRDR